MRFPLAGAFLNCYLSLYFMARICYRKHDRDFKRWETPAYILAFGYPTILGIVGVATQVFNTIPLLRICDYSPYPPYCDEPTSTETCERGESFRIQDWILFTLPLLLATILSTYGMIRVLVSVRRQLRATRRWTAWNSNSLGSDPQTPSSGPPDVPVSVRFSEGSEQRTRLVSTQAALYTLAYLNGLIWAFLVRLVYDTVEDLSERAYDPGLYVFQVLCYIFFPLQGFLNFLIFVRPIWLRHKQSTGSRQHAVQKTVRDVLSSVVAQHDDHGQEFLVDSLPKEEGSNEASEEYEKKQTTEKDGDDQVGASSTS